LELIEINFPLYTRNILQQENTIMQTIQRHIIHVEAQHSYASIAEQAMIFIDIRRSEEQDGFMFEMHLI